MRSPILLLMRMNAAETSASRAIADCTPLTVVSRSSTTAEIDTFISDVSTTSTNIAADSRTIRRLLVFVSSPIGRTLRRSEDRELDLLGELSEGDLERHADRHVVEVAVDDLGDHSGAFVEVDDRRHVGHPLVERREVVPAHD